MFLYYHNQNCPWFHFSRSEYIAMGLIHNIVLKVCIFKWIFKLWSVKSVVMSFYLMELLRLKMLVFILSRTNTNRNWHKCGLILRSSPVFRWAKYFFIGLTSWCWYILCWFNICSVWWILWFEEGLLTTCEFWFL